jgi:hypothetical protein
VVGCSGLVVYGLSRRDQLRRRDGDDESVRGTRKFGALVVAPLRILVVVHVGRKEKLQLTPVGQPPSCLPIDLFFHSATVLSTYLALSLI